MPRKHWASGIDQILAGQRFAVVVGDLEVPPSSVLRDAMSAIASAGPHTRVTLSPRPGRRTWSYEPSTPPAVHELPEHVVNAGTASVLEYLRRHPGHHRPVELHVGRDLVALHADHGIGDARTVLQLISALFAHAGGHSTPWVTTNGTSLALPHGLVRTFGSRPTRARSILRYGRDLRSLDKGRATAAGASVPWSPSVAVSIAHVDADADAAVNEWCRANAEKPGSAAVWLHIVRQALRVAGLRMVDHVMVAFDCRRYLPRRRSVPGNFVIGLEIPCETYEVSALSARIREHTDSATPLAGMAAVSLRALVRLRRKQITSSVCRPDAPAHLMYTDLGHITMFENLPWRVGNTQFFTALPDPAGPNAITVVNARVGGARALSIAFHDRVLDRQVIDRAAEYLRDPMRFLAPNVPKISR